MIDNFINTLYPQINEKTKFIKAAAEALGVSYFTIRNNWIGVGIIPKRQQEPLLNFTQNWIKVQNQITN